MIFGLNAFSNILIQNTYYQKIEFNKVKILGQNSGLIVDNLRLINLEDYSIAPSTPLQWDKNTLLLADFDNIYPSTPLANLQAGAVKEYTLPVDSLNLYKKEDNLNKYQFVNNTDIISEITNLKYQIGQIPFGGYSLSEDIKDFKCRNYKNYNYLAIPVPNDGKIAYYQTDISQDFFGWFLTDFENTATYKFDLENDIPDIEIVDGFTVFENYSETPFTIKGSRKYRKSSIKTIPYYFVNNEEAINIYNLEELEQFILNKKPKYLRSPSGEIIMVMTNNFNKKYMDNLWNVRGSIYEQPYTISFDWVEIGDVI